MEQIPLRGAREPHLKNPDLSGARNQLGVITGRSGPGWSSLACEPRHAGGQGRGVEGLGADAPQVLDRASIR